MNREELRLEALSFRVANGWVWSEIDASIAMADFASKKLAERTQEIIAKLRMTVDQMRRLNERFAAKTLDEMADELEQTYGKE
jgi:hypothetical protein